MYGLARSLLFRLDPETAHTLTLKGIHLGNQFRMMRWVSGHMVHDPVTVMGITFPNRVGLAAGLDKNADYLPALGSLGFGFVEVGTVTPQPQPGNPRPRLFRLPEHQAIINRMGFNNKGVAHLVDQLKRHRSGYAGVVGVNIGKNKDTPIERAVDDYVTCLQAVHAHADYIAINISSPNTPGLRTLQADASLDPLLSALKAEVERLDRASGRRVPIAVKIAPDMSVEALDTLADTLARNAIDGVIATNTTIDRRAIIGARHADEAGGLSGRPVAAEATRVVARLRSRLPSLPIIGAGGILSGHDALEKRRAGADLVELYSGLIYRGPRLVCECARALRDV